MDTSPPQFDYEERVNKLGEIEVFREGYWQPKY